MDAFANLFRDCCNAVVIADHQSKIVFANKASHMLFGDELSVLFERTSSACLCKVNADSQSPIFSPPFEEVLLNKSFCDREFLLRASYLEEDRWLTITGHPFILPETNFKGGMLIIHDITHYKKTSFQESEALSYSNEIGLVNHAMFVDRVKHALIRTQRNNIRIAILSLSVQHRNTSHKQYPCPQNDKRLLEVIDGLKQVLEPEHTLSRIRENEFLILVEDVISYSQVTAIAQDIHTSLLTLSETRTVDYSGSVDIGISLGSHCCLDAETLLRQAESAMQESKQSPSKQYCVFEDPNQTDISNTLYLEIALEKAIANRELFLEYQPIFSVRHKTIIGVESLVRWQHPEKGLLPPSRFIPLAEKTGLIIPLGLWVLEESCRQLKQWQMTIPEAQQLFVSVNMSSKQFSQNSILEEISNVLQIVNLSPKSLVIEITESVLIENSSSIVEILEAIRKMGIKLSIDDFGTGYSSLSYLHRFPFDTLKIDRSFLENADSDFEKLEILQSMVRLAWNLGLEVVAEGIETQKHFAQIKALRCESGQGYLFSRPLKSSAVEALIKQQVNNCSSLNKADN
ncbi:EAL domain-containing protein [Oscillatoria sp. CS-180]|uniref:sensor domain-containing protein n=1 Tax=Oscillatoria sp. CS-180 TaxID=3021720 RepID=UPI002330D5CE|nr:GGDEF domain-containing phosphodiesterase [Oscillatoria sp. CS-180]MDB9528853.1 EAL domain-containing protein [Oscillatoria sp. CS-180]